MQLWPLAGLIAAGLTVGCPSVALAAHDGFGLAVHDLACTHEPWVIAAGIRRRRREALRSELRNLATRLGELSPSVLRRVASKLRRLYRAATRQDFVEHDGAVLPPPELRLCSARMRDDAWFLRSAELEAERHVARLGCTPDSRVLEIGCGSGRLAIGLARRFERLDYHGVDILRSHIDWCERHISQRRPSFKFTHLDVHNDRYNPKGVPIDDEFRLPWPDACFDIVYMYAVITNMTEDHTRAYVREVCRLLKPSGKAFISGFAERDVAPVSINPEGYLGLKPSGPLFLVRYRQEHLESIFEQHGLNVDAVEKMEGEMFDSLTGFYLSKPAVSRRAVRRVAG